MSLQYFTGQTRGAPTIAQCESYDFGEVTQLTDSWPPRRRLWLWDNTEFYRWVNGIPLDLAWTRRLQAHLARGVEWANAGHPPEYAVLPDIVAGGEASLSRSAAWVGACRELMAPLLVAVQDGMTIERVERWIRQHDVQGVFIGGTKAWKWRTAPAWATWAKAHGLLCHIGRVGCWRDIRRAIQVGATGADSCQGLWSHEQLARCARALRAPHLRQQVDAFDGLGVMT